MRDTINKVGDDMFDISRNNTISLTRGNSAAINITMQNSATQELITLGESDKVVLTVKSYNKEKVLQKIVTSENRVSEEQPIYECLFYPDDTINIPTGHYKYDVMLILADGQVVTFISSNLVLIDAIGLYTDITTPETTHDDVSGGDNDAG